MARPSTVYLHTNCKDTEALTLDSGEELSFDESAKEEFIRDNCEGSSPNNRLLPHNGEESELEEQLGIGQEEGEDADDEHRRDSTFTRTSVSSLPGSVLQTDNEGASIPMHKPYTPPVIRPSFRRPESVQRMQMSSPPPYSSRSARQSVIRYPRSRTGTPQSLHSVAARGSPRPRRKASVETREEEALTEFPLVLLHVTLLPINLPWSVESMQELLPRNVLESLQLLKLKITGTILQRGLLIPHPREEYELLEERLLEGLELKEERITKCGHFRSQRDSTASFSTTDGSDSGFGSTVESSSEDVEFCSTCRHHVKGPPSTAVAGRRKWSIKVYASNGLMRTSAWAAAWSEMERVDVEITPWMSEELVKMLNTRREEEQVKQEQEQEQEDKRIKAVVEEQVRLAHERVKRANEIERALPECDHPSVADPQSIHIPEVIVNPEKRLCVENGLPQVYRPSEVPLEVLLRNYIFLLLQDPRNVIIFFLAVLALWLGLRSSSTAEIGLSQNIADACIPYQDPVPVLQTLAPNASITEDDVDVGRTMNKTVPAVSVTADKLGTARTEFSPEWATDAGNGSELDIVHNNSSTGLLVNTVEGVTHDSQDTAAADEANKMLLAEETEDMQ